MRKNVCWAAGLTLFYLLLDLYLHRCTPFLQAAVSLVGSFAGFFVFSVFLSSLYRHKYLTYAVPLVALTAAVPLLNFFYYQTYAEFMPYTLLQILLREPLFLLATFWMQAKPYWAGMLVALVLWYVATHRLLRPLFNNCPAKPFTCYTKHFSLLLAVPAALIISLLTVYKSYKMAVCAYILTAAIGLPFMIFLFKYPHPKLRNLTGVLFACFSLTMGFYAFWGQDKSSSLLLAANTQLTLLQTLYFPSLQRDISQPPHVQEQYKQIPPPDIPFNILVIVNDGMRARNLGAYGYTPRFPDQALAPFYQKSFIFQYALSPGNFTLLSLPAMFSSQGHERGVTQLQNARRLWDFAPAGVFTFYVLSANQKWGQINEYLSSFNLQHIWDFAGEAAPIFDALDMVDDAHAVAHTRQLIATHPRYIGVLHTNATHFPFYQNPGISPYYKPCSFSNRASWPQALINCYDNAIRHTANEEARLLQSVDLSNTVVIITADHGQQFFEHNAYFYGSLYDENIHVPFIWYIPPKIRQQIPPAYWKNFEQNTQHYVGNIDMVPTLLHLAALLTHQPDTYREADFSGRSLFLDRAHQLVVSSGCAKQWICPFRTTVFADDHYVVLFQPNRRPMLEIYAAYDIHQQTPLATAQVDPAALQNIYRNAPQLHPMGHLVQTVLKKQFPTLEK